jgi:hypothetical protein
MRPPVTPIFPRNNGSRIPSENNVRCAENLPIRKTDPREHVLNSGGFNGRFNPEIAHSVHNSPNYYNQPPSTIISCISIAQHIDSCPICSRLYDTDKTLYILAIIGLLILCFLMVKRIVKL